MYHNVFLKMYTYFSLTKFNIIDFTIYCVALRKSFCYAILINNLLFTCF